MAERLLSLKSSSSFSLEWKSDEYYETKVRKATRRLGVGLGENPRGYPIRRLVVIDIYQFFGVKSQCCSFCYEDIFYIFSYLWTSCQNPKI
jgi:hypothetical protein